MKIVLRSNIFQADEVPVRKPPSFDTFSIGEEPSSGLAIKVSWSPSGLSKHSRCALAVLTSNLALSIWAPGTLPRSPASWRRVLVVNHALLLHFGQQGSRVNSLNDTSTRRSRQRIRCFVWSHPRPSSGSMLMCQPISENLSNHILAVSNDTGEVSSRIAAQQRWSATVLHHVPLSSSASSMNSNPSALFEDFLHNRGFFHALSWSPWVLQRNEEASYTSWLACANKNELIFIQIFLQLDRQSLEEKQFRVGRQERFTIALQQGSPLKWTESVDDNGMAILVAFAASAVVSFSVSLAEPSVIQMDEHDLSGRWDQISGQP